MWTVAENGFMERIKFCILNYITISKERLFLFSLYQS